MRLHQKLTIDQFGINFVSIFPYCTILILFFMQCNNFWCFLRCFWYSLIISCLCCCLSVLHLRFNQCCSLFYFILLHDCMKNGKLQNGNKQFPAFKYVILGGRLRWSAWDRGMNVELNDKGWDCAKYAVFGDLCVKMVLCSLCRLFASLFWCPTGLLQHLKIFLIKEFILVSNIFKKGHFHVKFLTKR